MSTKVLMVVVLIKLLCVIECWSDYSFIEQWEVLMSVYNSTNGKQWLRKDFWNCSGNQLENCRYCFWYGITCDSYSNVTDIVLMDNNLTGSLPPTLWKLRHLEKLVLNFNKNLGGKLEDFIYGNMTKLKIIDLSFCGFEGAIPEEISLLTNLEELRLCSQRGTQKLNGSIPQGIAKLTKLRVLGLGENTLTVPSPSRLFGALTKLEVLDLENVTIRSTFDVFRNLTGLKSMNLSKTGLYGELPSNLGKRFPKMEELLLPGNNLSGSIPNSIGMIKNLTRLSLANNKLSGVIPGNITLATKLSFIDLSVNNLLSIHNESLLLAHDLEILLLSDNRNLNVNFAQFLSPNTKTNSGPAKLKVLIISNCGFYGKIPKSIWSFGNLIYVNARRNKLRGYLPEVLAPMYTLLHFDVSHNDLEGQIPSTLTRIESLHLLDIRGNHNMTACSECKNYTCCKAVINQHGLEISFKYMPHKPDAGNFSCPMAFLRVTKGPVYLDARYYEYMFCKCDRGYYGEGKTCRRCMKGGKCVDTDSHHMFIRKGYWPEPSPENVTHLQICDDKEDFFNGGRHLTACNPSGNCSCHLTSSSSGIQTTCSNITCLCRKGSFKRLCSRCEKRWYKSGSICRECPSHHHATYIFIGVLLVTLLIFAAALLYLKSRPRLGILVIYGQILILFFLRFFNVIPAWVFEINVIILLFYLAGMGSSTKGLQKIAVFYFQILDAMLSTYKMWPKAILQGQHYISSLINFNFPGLMCDIPYLYTPTGQFILLILLPVVCIFIAWLFYCLVWIANRIRATAWNVLSIKYHCLQISVTCLNLTYFPIGLRSIAVLASCRDHSSHMRIAPWIPCNSPTNSFLQTLAWLSTVTYVIGVPLFVFLPLLLRYVRAHKRSKLTKQEKEALDKWLGSIYLPYKEKCRSFCEVYALLRKLLLAFLIGYIPEVSSLQTFFVSMVLAIALILHLVWQPYQSSLGWLPIENILETIVLVVLQQSFILLRFTTVEKPYHKKVHLLWIIVVVNCMVLFILMVIISMLLAKHAAKSLKNQSRNESSRTNKFRNDLLSYFRSKNSLFKPLLMREDKDTSEDE